MIEIYDQYKDRPKFNLEKGGGKLITEQDGYVPVRIQVETMLDAGRRLMEARRNAEFDIPEGSEIEDAEIDPTRSPDFDLADASAIDRALGERSFQVDKELEEKKNAKVEEKPGEAK